jgi:tetratricopeptide (TPR) repeat protein
MVDAKSEEAPINDGPINDSAIDAAPTNPEPGDVESFSAGPIENGPTSEAPSSDGPIIGTPNTSSGGRRASLTILAALFLAAVVLIVYGQGVYAPMVFDDASSVDRNTSIRRLWPLLGDAAGPGPLNPLQDSTTAGRPLVNLSLAINYHYGQFAPVGYHIFNVIVHAISTVLLFVIVRRVLRTDYFAETFQRTAGPLALAVALIWAVHPLQTEAVEYITQRTELMMGFCYLATIYASLRYFAAVSLPARIVWLALATLVCAAGMACKEVMVTAPVAVLLLERTFLTKSFRNALRQSWPLYLGLSATWLLLAALNYNGPRATSAGFHLDVPAYAWWLTQSKVLLIYLKLAVWPWPLVIHYETPYLYTLNAAWPYALSVAALGLVTLYLLGRGTATGFLAACVFLILSPTLVVPIISEIAAERRMYLPLAAIVALLVTGGYAVAKRAAEHFARSDETASRRWWPLGVTLCATLVVAVTFSLLSMRRLTKYVDAVTLWSDAATHQPDNAMVLTNLGGELVKAGRFAEAVKVYDTMLGPLPEWTILEPTPAADPANDGKSPEEIARAERLLKLNATEAEAHNNMGVALTFSDRAPEALGRFLKALQINPQFADAQMNAGNALIATGRYEESIPYYEAALRLNPNLARAHGNLGFALKMLGRFELAAIHLEVALRLEPTYLKASADLTGAYAEMGQSNEAIASAERTIAIARSQQKLDDVNSLEAWLANYRRYISQPKGSGTPIP